jgi:hypothetical protein
MDTKEKLIEAIREVPISKTYEEYVEALADRLEIVIEDTRNDTLWEVYNHFLKMLPVKPMEEGK